MNLSSSACLLACVFAFTLVVHVQAGFCDGKIGSYCRVKDGRDVTTKCTCELKKKKKKDGSTAYKTDCDNTGDLPCYNGCKNTRSCYKDHELCATKALNDVSVQFSGTTHTLVKTCPAVVASTYRTWKNREENSDAKEQEFLKLVVSGNTAFSKAVLLPKLYESTALGKDAIEKAFDTNCKADDVAKMNCYRYFPKCENKKGSNADCQQQCTKVMACVSSVEAACLTANPGNEAVCKKYTTVGPYGGSVDCYSVCAEYQPDNISAGSFLTPFMNIAFAMMTIAFIM